VTWQTFYQTDCCSQKVRGSQCHVGLQPCPCGVNASYPCYACVVSLIYTEKSGKVSRGLLSSPDLESGLSITSPANPQKFCDGWSTRAGKAFPCWYNATAGPKINGTGEINVNSPAYTPLEIFYVVLSCIFGCCTFVFAMIVSCALGGAEVIMDICDSGSGCCDCCGDLLSGCDRCCDNSGSAPTINDIGDGDGGGGAASAADYADSFSSDDGNVLQGRCPSCDEQLKTSHRSHVQQGQCTKNDGVCKICKEEEATQMPAPCGHFGVCPDCDSAAKGVCPFCQAPVGKWVG